MTSSEGLLSTMPLEVLSRGLLSTMPLEVLCAIMECWLVENDHLVGTATYSYAIINADDGAHRRVPWYLRAFHAAALSCRRFALAALMMRQRFADYYVSKQRVIIGFPHTSSSRRKSASEVVHSHQLCDGTLHGKWLRQAKSNTAPPEASSRRGGSGTGYRVVERRRYCFGQECGVRECFDPDTGALTHRYHFPSQCEAGVNDDDNKTSLMHIELFQTADDGSTVVMTTTTGSTKHRNRERLPPSKKKKK